MSGFLKVILIGLVVLFAYGYITRPAVQHTSTTPPATPSYSGFNAQDPKVTPPTPAPSHLGIGDIGTIQNGAPVIMLSATKDGYDDINKGTAALDKVGLRNLILSGRAFTVKAGTSAKVIDLSFAMRRVRILDGEKADLAGWLPYEYVR
jgi:hypothetical protein